MSRTLKYLEVFLAEIPTRRNPRHSLLITQTRKCDEKVCPVFVQCSLPQEFNQRRAEATQNHKSLLKSLVLRGRLLDYTLPLYPTFRAKFTPRP